jgi:hypothetical protein
VVSACRKAGVNFSLTLQSNAKLQAATDTIGEAEWVPMRYPGAVYDQHLQRWISNAEVAETSYTAFETTTHKVTARLVVRRVRELNPAPPGQEELFPVWRHHAFLTDTDLPTVHADQTHRSHAIIEQLFADLIDGPLAHMPSELDPVARTPDVRWPWPSGRMSWYLHHTYHCGIRTGVPIRTRQT